MVVKCIYYLQKECIQVHLHKQHIAITPIGMLHSELAGSYDAHSVALPIPLFACKEVHITTTNVLNHHLCSHPLQNTIKHRSE